METQDETKVVETPAGDGAESTTAEAPENESSPEVKQESNGAGNSVDSQKLQDQINNLNIALKAERDEKRASGQKAKELEDKIAAYEEKLSIVDRLGEAFNPTQEREEETPPAGLTLEQLEDFWSQKEEERARKDKEAQQATAIRNEISEMETAWDGKNGKPKYDDDAVVQWQKENGKLHLTPKAAFYEMKHSEIVDYEVKQRLGKKPNVQNVETPGGTPAGREPAESKPTGTLETRAAVLEAMENSMAENNN